MSNQYLNKFMILPDNGYYFLESEIMNRWMDIFTRSIQNLEILKNDELEKLCFKT
jgi:hypothetical protein